MQLTRTQSSHTLTYSLCFLWTRFLFSSNWTKIGFYTKKIITRLKILFRTLFIMHSIYIHQNHFCTWHIMLIFIYPPSIYYYLPFHMSHCISLSISYLFLLHWLLKFSSSRPLFVLASDTICDTQIPCIMVYKTCSFSAF